MAKKTSKSTESPKVTATKKTVKTVKAVTPKKIAASKAIAPKVTKAPKAPVISKKKRISKATASVSLDPIQQLVEPVIHHDDICLRAYFIGERRQKMGWPGDSANDWLDAIKQLKAEALEKPLKKR